jgi:hypothetical protein
MKPDALYLGQLFERYHKLLKGDIALLELYGKPQEVREQKKVLKASMQEALRVLGSFIPPREK